MSDLNFLFFRYDLTADDIALSGTDQYQLLKENEGREFAYRKPESPSNRDSRVLVVNQTSVALAEGEKEYQVIYFRADRHVTERSFERFDKVAQQYQLNTEETDEDHWGRAVMIPELKIICASDQTKEGRLKASGIIGRLQSLVRLIPGHKLVCNPAVDRAALEKAMRTWKIEKFSFDARPFNPHPSRPGDLMSALLKSNNGQLSGSVTPWKGDTLDIPEKEDNFVREIEGLAHKGYGHYGATGRTEEGYEAKIKKPSPSKEKSEPESLSILFSAMDSEEQLAKAVARSALRIYE